MQLLRVRLGHSWASLFWEAEIVGMKWAVGFLQARRTGLPVEAEIGIGLDLKFDFVLADW